MFSSSPMLSNLVIATAPLPFIGMLLTLAFAPLLMPKVWHRYERAFLVLWSLLGGAAIVAVFGVSHGAHLIGDTLWHEYIPFLAILFALFTVSGSIRIHIDYPYVPFVNVVIVGIASCMASLIGTTGASMLFIRPLLTLNANRRQVTHLVIFFIIVVSNIAGALTPLGDPPLFLGYLNGVPFTWPFLALWKPIGLTFAFLMVIFYGVDRYFYQKESKPHQASFSRSITIQGKRHVPVLVMIIAMTATFKNLPDTVLFTLSDLTFCINDSVYVLSLIGLGFLSFWLADPKVHKAQQFNFAPVFEVARVFLVIFITLIPLNAMLQMGDKGPFSSLLSILHHEGLASPKAYFWLTGLFSSFLDNAPTYLVFLKLTGKDIATLLTETPLILKGISLGAVLMGAMTYIGNAPNFMVLSLARQRGIFMPSFFIYTVLVATLLIPIFWVMTALFL